MYLLLAFAYQKIEWRIPPLIAFSTINNKSMSVKRSNFILVVFKAACHINPGAEKNEQDLAHMFQHTYFKSSQIHQLTIMYCFEDTDYDNPPNFLF